MAIDTLAKRSSALNVGMPWHVTLPPADGSIGQGDRQHVAHQYSGILAGAAPSILNGPWRVAAIETHTSGAVVGEATVSGPQAAETHISGVVIGEGVDHG